MVRSTGIVKYFRPERRTAGTRWWVVGCAVGVVGLASSWVIAQQRQVNSKPRVAHKKFDTGETRRIFFDDVFEVLVGSRPAQLDRPSPSTASAASGAPRASSSSVAGSSADPAGDRKWSALISAATIEDEIKAIKQLVDREVTNPSEFRGRGYRECRQHFSIAAMLFGIVHEYDGEVRWKRTAAAARDLFSRSAANAKVGSPQVFNEARQRKLDLEDIVGGSVIRGGREPAEENPWGSLVDRGPLMMRLETAFDRRIQEGTASASEARSGRERLIHEAELVALIAAILVQEGMPDGDDVTYREYADEMQRGAAELIRGVRENDYEAIRGSVGVIGQSCSNCHEYYRG
jgi:hypothetical protein